LGESRARNAVKFFSYKLRVTRNQEKISTDELRMRTAFQRFINEMPRSTFKKLIVSTPGLIQGLHTMSLSKSVPEGLNPRECERTKFRKPLPVPFIPRKTRSRKKSPSYASYKSRLLWRRTPLSTFQCGRRMGPVRPFSCM
jgi:hypothetical protein